MLPNKYTALVWIAALSLALNVLAVGVVGAFLYVAIDFTKHELEQATDFALYVMEEARHPNLTKDDHEPSDADVLRKKRIERGKRRAVKPKAIAGTEIDVTAPKCCV